MNLSRIDLNLLVVLDTLLTTRSVSKAADVLCLSQPAVSHALNRLRRLIGDDILVKTGRAMVPTPHALRLQAPVRALLGQVTTLLDREQPFEPAQCTDTFSLSASEYVDLLLLPHIVRRLRAEAPGARILIRHMNIEAVNNALDNGDIDAAVGFDAPQFSHLKRTELFEESYGCLVKAGHPGFGTDDGLAQYLASPHVEVSTSERFNNILSNALLKARITRQVAASLPRYFAAAELIATTDVVGTLPLRVAKHFSRVYPLQVTAVPVQLPRFSFCVFWNQRTDTDPAHQWLRSIIYEASRVVGLDVAP